MMELLIDALLDVIKSMPFLYAAFLLMEYIEHSSANKFTRALTKANKSGPVIGACLGAIPQCGFSLATTNLYVAKIVSLGTLIAVYLSTSDEMLPIMIANKAPLSTILEIIGLKILIGIIAGFLIDMLYHPKSENVHFAIEKQCQDAHCHCGKNILFSALIHTLKISGYLLIITVLLNGVLEYLPEGIIQSVLLQDTIFGPLVASLVGLIPNCGSSVILTELYLNQVISFASALSGLLTNSGVALLVLFRLNKRVKENLIIVLLVYMIGVLSGIIAQIIV